MSWKFVPQRFVRHVCIAPKSVRCHWADEAVQKYVASAHDDAHRGDKYSDVHVLDHLPIQRRGYQLVHTHHWFLKRDTISISKFVIDMYTAAKSIWKNTVSLMNSRHISNMLKELFLFYWRHLSLATAQTYYFAWLWKLIASIKYAFSGVEMSACREFPSTKASMFRIIDWKCV